MTVAQAMKKLTEDEAAKLVNDDELKVRAVTVAEQNGIVFIDEIDKVAKRGETSGTDISREGVQRDLLPLIEGCTVSTKYGMIKTDHILFTASGMILPLLQTLDLIPEHRARLPIRVELESLTSGDFERILTEPSASLTEQYRELLATESSASALPPMALSVLRKLPLMSMSGRRISVPDACIPSWNVYRRKCRSKPPISVKKANPSILTVPMSINT